MPWTFSQVNRSFASGWGNFVKILFSIIVQERFLFASSSAMVSSSFIFCAGSFFPLPTGAVSFSLAEGSTHLGAAFLRLGGGGTGSLSDDDSTKCMSGKTRRKNSFLTNNNRMSPIPSLLDVFSTLFNIFVPIGCKGLGIRHV